MSEMVAKIQDGSRHHVEYRKNSCHLFSINQSSPKFSRNIATSIQNTSAMSKRLVTTIKDGGRPPSWILKNCCYFITVRPILTKLSGNIGTSI